MKLRAKLLTLASLIVALAALPVVSSCGTMHSYWGVENDYYSDGYGGHHKPKKPKKPKKHKKHGHKHHDNDWWDD
ncbi:MAG: hypothetical protein NC111_06225 [Bacteroides sp.]|nr:hypothetical protein [Bacteroides sp.]MCM1413154.1 hypothetical protein [Bacteroides sp.]MCM1472104.1 hypothetical protein [Bacteroides sp.]